MLVQLEEKNIRSKCTVAYLMASSVACYFLFLFWYIKLAKWMLFDFSSHLEERHTECNNTKSVKTVAQLWHSVGRAQRLRLRLGMRKPLAAKYKAATIHQVQAHLYWKLRCTEASWNVCHTIQLPNGFDRTEKFKNETKRKMRHIVREQICAVHARPYQNEKFCNSQSNEIKWIQNSAKIGEFFTKVRRNHNNVFDVAKETFFDS